MRSYFHRYPASTHCAQSLRQLLLCRCYAAFFHHLTVTIQYAVAAGFIPQVHADCDPSFRPFPTLLTSVILLHGRSPFALRVRSIGSLSHPAGGRPSHPISDWLSARCEVVASTN